MQMAHLKQAVYNWHDNERESRTTHLKCCSFWNQGSQAIHSQEGFTPSCIIQHAHEQVKLTWHDMSIYIQRFPVS
jgi:hypothetical protein